MKVHFLVFRSNFSVKLAKLVSRCGRKMPFGIRVPVRRLRFGLTKPGTDAFLLRVWACRLMERAVGR